MVTKIDASTLKSMVFEMNAALAAVATKHGVKIHVGGGRYGELSADMKVKIEVVDVAGHAAEAKRLFAAYARHLGLQESDLGSTFNFRGHQFQVTGLNPNAPKFCVLAKRAFDGKEYRFPADVINSRRAALPVLSDRRFA